MHYYNNFSVNKARKGMREKRMFVQFSSSEWGSEEKTSKYLGKNCDKRRIETKFIFHKTYFIRERRHGATKCTTDTQTPTTCSLLKQICKENVRQLQQRAMYLLNTHMWNRWYSSNSQCTYENGNGTENKNTIFEWK